jgi:hypothetical protein
MSMLTESQQKQDKKTRNKIPKKPRIQGNVARGRGGRGSGKGRGDKNRR